MISLLTKTQNLQKNYTVKQEIEFGDYYNCLEANQLENKRNYLE